MFIPDMPDVPPQNVPVMIAQANQAQQGSVTTTRTLGVCYPASISGQDTLSPIASAQNYFFDYENQKTVTSIATVTILQQPKHGILRLLTEADRGTLFRSSSGPIDPADPGYVFFLENGYAKDSATFLVNFGGGLAVKVVYFFQKHEGPQGNSGLKDLCSKTGLEWKISSNLDANGNSILTSVDYRQNIASTDALAKTSKLHSSAFW